MPYLRKIPLTGEALERYHFNRLQIRMEEHIRIEGNDAYLYDDDDADYDDEDDDHNEHENDNDKTVGYLSDTISKEVLVGYCTPDELERDPVSSIKRQRPNHDVHEQNGITRRGEEQNSHDIVSCINMKKRSKKHYDHDHYHKCQPKELLHDVTKPRPDVTIPGPLDCDSLDEHIEEDTSLNSTPMDATIDATFKQGFEINPSIFNNHTNRIVSVSRSKRLSFDARNEDEQFAAPPCGGEDKFLAPNRQHVWTGPPKLIRVATFSDRIEDLRQYKAMYGHCDVSTTGEFKSLATWCSTVRTSKKKMEGHLKGSTRRIKLSEERVQQLTELGFNWMGRKQNKPKTFSEWFEDLRQYKAKYGHCNVPTTTCEFKSLAKWCSKLRTSKKRIEGHLKGGSTRRYELSEERVQQLTELGFRWAARN